MANIDRGMKRHCKNCGAKFYDLGRRPIVCPACGTVYELETGTAKPVAARVSKPEPEEEEAAPATAAGAPEFVSLEEAEPAETATVDGEEDVDLGGADEAISDGEDADVFLEDDEEDQTDVKEFIGGGGGEER